MIVRLKRGDYGRKGNLSAAFNVYKQDRQPLPHLLMRRWNAGLSSVGLANAGLSLGGRWDRPSDISNSIAPAFF